MGFHSVNADAEIITIDCVVKSVDVEKRTITIESGAPKNERSMSAAKLKLPLMERTPACLN